MKHPNVQQVKKGAFKCQGKTWKELLKQERKMKLDRNVESNEGRGKYALILMRVMDSFRPHEVFGILPQGIKNAIRTLEKRGIISWGKEGAEDEFFVIRLKDKYAAEALFAYAKAADLDGNYEWANEVQELAMRSGTLHPNCKTPD